MKTLTVIMLAGLVLVAATVLAQDGDSATSSMEIVTEKSQSGQEAGCGGRHEAERRGRQDILALVRQVPDRIGPAHSRLGALINAYADAHNARRGMISKEKANALLNEALAVEEAEVRAKQAYAKELSKVLPATAIARPVRIETIIRAALKFDLAGRIPLVY